MCGKKRRPMIALGWRSAPAQRCTVVNIKSTPYSTAASAYAVYVTPLKNGLLLKCATFPGSTAASGSHQKAITGTCFFVFVYSRNAVVSDSGACQSQVTTGTGPVPAAENGGGVAP